MFTRTIKKKYVFVAIQAILMLVWIFLPNVSLPANQALAGGRLDYAAFMKYDLYLFLAEIFLFFFLLSSMGYRTFLILEALLLLTIGIKIYIAVCAK